MKKISTLPGSGGGNGLKNLCYDGYVKIPGSFGEHGHAIALAGLIGALSVPTISFMDLMVVERGVCGSVKRGAKGDGVIRALGEFATLMRAVCASAERRFEAGSEGQRQVSNSLKEWEVELEQAVRLISPPPPPPVAVSQMARPVRAVPAPATSDGNDTETAALIASMESRLHAPPIVQPATAAPSGKLPIACSCGHSGTVKAKYAGRIVMCPKCKSKIQVAH
jgi:hypothetical protein